jgi:LysR family transcriptional regulator for metE and metH
VDIKIEVDATGDPFEALLNGLLDIAFVNDDTTDRAIESAVLFEDEMKLIVAPDHPLAGQPFARASDFAGETFLTYSALRGNLVYDRLLRPAGVEPKKHLQVRLTEAIVELVKAGTGIAVLAQWAAAPYVAAGSVVAIPLTRRGMTRQWKVARLAARPMSPFLRAFVDMVATKGPGALRLASSLTPARMRRPAS